MNCLACGKQLTKKQEWHKRKHCSPACYHKSQIGRIVSPESARKTADGLRGIPKSQEHRKNLSKSLMGKYTGENSSMYSKKLSLEVKEKIGQSNTGKQAWNKGTKKVYEFECKVCGLLFKTHNKKSNGCCSKRCAGIFVGRANKHKKLSTEHKRKIGLAGIGRIYGPEFCLKSRLNAINRIINNYGQCWPSYNKKACEYFKKFDEENYTDSKYAVYGGGEYHIKKLGYFLDYINFDKKLIIEWDEESHYENDKLKDKDVIRQKEIQDLFPNFTFNRIREKDFIGEVK